MKNNIVMWSGGADSTLLIEELIRSGQQVRAIAITNYPWLPQEQLERQNQARINYLNLRHKHKIVHETISIGGTFKIYGDVANRLRQPLIFLSLAAPILGEGDILHLGWNFQDNLDEQIPIFSEAFHAMMRLKGISAEFAYKLREDAIDKQEVLLRLKQYGVPDNCWWACERPWMGNPCRMCPKCLEIRNAK